MTRDPAGDRKKKGYPQVPSIATDWLLGYVLTLVLAAIGLPLLLGDLFPGSGVLFLALLPFLLIVALVGQPGIWLDIAGAVAERFTRTTREAAQSTPAPEDLRCPWCHRQFPSRYWFTTARDGTLVCVRCAPDVSPTTQE